MASHADCLRDETGRAPDSSECDCLPTEKRTGPAHREKPFAAATESSRPKKAASSFIWFGSQLCCEGAQRFPAGGPPRYELLPAGERLRGCFSETRICRWHEVRRGVCQSFERGAECFWTSIYWRPDQDQRVNPRIRSLEVAKFSWVKTRLAARNSRTQYPRAGHARPTFAGIRVAETSGARKKKFRDLSLGLKHFIGSTSVFPSGISSFQAPMISVVVYSSPG